MYQFKFLQSMHEIPAKEWNSLLKETYPFLKHEFLLLLESSGSVSAQTGWQPQHLIVRKDDRLVAAMPLYIKTHSYGEYVFDWAWARAYQEHELAYYPKLVNCIPFTPCGGARLLIREGEDLSELMPSIISSIQTHCKTYKFSGWHSLFSPQEFSDSLSQFDSGLLQRIDVQFHWHNRNYSNWNDFIDQLQSRKRKNIVKERQAVKDQGILFETKIGSCISESDLKTFYQFYQNTYWKRSGHSGYLSESFFVGLAGECANHLVLVEAKLNDKVIAAALFFKDADKLYGRYWGCQDNYDFLHFETCYYQGIDYAIAHNLKQFDGGAQGEHKIARGFEPKVTYSNHWILRTDFRAAIARFLVQERESILAYSDDAKNHLPFKSN